MAGVVPEHAAAVVEAAAWLHDIGYASPLVDSGFHPLDGARYLRRIGFGDRLLWTLVAHHTCALVEAEERGLADILAAEFPVGRRPAAGGVGADLLRHDDRPGRATASTWSSGSRRSWPATGPDHVVHRSIARAAPSLRQQADEVSAVLGRA